MNEWAGEYVIVTGSSGFDFNVITVSINEESIRILWLCPRSCHPWDHSAVCLILSCFGGLVILRLLGSRSRQHMIVGSEAFCQLPLLLWACRCSSQGGEGSWVGLWWRQGHHSGGGGAAGQSLLCPCPDHLWSLNVWCHIWGSWACMSPQWELDVTCKVQDFKGVILEMSCPWASFRSPGREGLWKGPKVSDLGVRIHTSCHLPRLELEAVGSWPTLPPLEYLGPGGCFPAGGGKGSCLWADLGNWEAGATQMSSWMPAPPPSQPALFQPCLPTQLREPCPTGIWAGPPSLGLMVISLPLSTLAWLNSSSFSASFQEDTHSIHSYLASTIRMSSLPLLSFVLF